MPGIYTAVDRSDGADVGGLLARMLGSVQHYRWYVAGHYADTQSGVALGHVSLGRLDQGAQPVCSRDGSVVVVMDGELYDYAQQRRALEAAGLRFAGHSHAEVLLHGYCSEHKQFFAKLNGKFIAAIWDAGRNRLIVTNDRFGMRPLYYAKRLNKLLAASEIKAILIDPAVSRKPNIAGIAQFLTYGHYLGNDTSFEAIRLLPAAGWLVYDLADDRLSVDRYWQLDLSQRNGCTKVELLDRIDGAFHRAVSCRATETQGLGLSLSGGLDARTILAAVDHDRVPVTSVAMGIEGCADHRCASRLAALSNRRHHNYVLREDFLDNFESHLRQMVHLTDGQYLSQCIVMPTLPFYRELGIDVLIRGHAGELMHMSKAYNFSLDRRGLAIRNEAELEDWAFHHLRAYMREAVDGPLLAPQHGDASDALARDSLRACLRESTGMEPTVQQMWHLFLTQRSRRETALSLVKFGSLVETRLPYLDNDLVDVLMAAPPEMKLAETIQAHILRRRRPGFLDVINVNTSARIGSGKAVRSLATFRQRVLAKLGVRGYQPYEKLGLWLRCQLRPLVEQTLLDDRCLGRGILHPDTVVSVVRQHLRKQRNHTYLLLAMMVLELGQRMFVDADCPTGQLNAP